MSGGSYNYAGVALDAEGLANNLTSAQELLGDLVRHGAPDAVIVRWARLINTLALLRGELDCTAPEIIRALDAEVDALQPVTRALEWWQSCDWGEDEFREACREWLAKNGEVSADGE